MAGLNPQTENMGGLVRWENMGTASINEGFVREIRAEV
jgi:hypothetical protein